MPWFNVDDGAHCHPKVIMAGNAAFGLFTRLGSYSSAYATEGRVPAAIVHSYGSKAEISRLMAAGMLHRDGDDYVMHDFLDYNRDAAQIARDRAKAAERKRRQRERERSQQERDSHGVTGGVTDGVSHGPQAKPSQAKPSTTASFHTSAAAEMGGQLPAAAAAALDILIEHKVATEAKHNPKGLRMKLRTDLPIEWASDLISYLDEHPDATVHELAMNVLGLSELDIHRIGKEIA